MLSRRWPRPQRHRHGVAQAVVLVGSALALLLAGCASQGMQGAPLAKNQVFVWPYTGASKIAYGEVLDPAAVTAQQDVGTISMLYTNLVTFDDKLRVIPDAITRMPDVDATGTVYTFHLRPNMHFNDGVPITAMDFAYGIDRALNGSICSALDDKTYGQDGTQECSGAPIAESYLGHILGAVDRAENNGPSLIANGDDAKKGLDVLDPLTLRIRLDSPVSYFLDGLTYPTSAPMEKQFVEKAAYASGQWVDHLDQGGTSGPFEVKSYGNGTQLTLVPNRYWETAWGKPLTLTEVDRPIVGSKDQTYTDYRAGKYDFTEVPATAYNFARGQSDFFEIPTMETDYFGLNFNIPPFDNPQLRTAFDLALNKQLLVDRVENGGALPTFHIVPRGMPGFDESLTNPPPDGTKSVTGNQAKALDVLAQAQAACANGSSPAPDSCKYFTGEHPTEIDLWSRGNDQTIQQLSTGAVAQWDSTLTYQYNGKPVNLNVQVKDTKDFGDELAHVYARDPANPTLAANPYQMWEIGWVADYPDPQDFLSLQFKTNIADNAEGIHVKALDALFQKADAEANPQQRLADYATAEQSVVNLSPWIPFQQEKFFWRQRTWVHGFTINALLNMTDVNWPNVYITQQS